ncbi:uncharacterized protein LOC101849877 [Aplysia californica]|uniref:Uncharacterized protein LOC101849877 n=1 Tax=Aplysia californica TaxID=6500 RepID=A0ABM0K2H2_APLCA|nr:uncharacterized protein LOC101849877 [Aplysia californica]
MANAIKMGYSPSPSTQYRNSRFYRKSCQCRHQASSTGSGKDPTPTVFYRATGSVQCVGLGLADTQSLTSRPGVTLNKGTGGSLENKEEEEIRELAVLGTQCQERTGTGFAEKPSAVSCDQPRFSGDNSSVSLTCETDRVYPQALCQFYWKLLAGGPVGRIDNTDVQYSHTAVRSSSVTYYRSTCNQTVPLSSLQAGDITFTVNMYPEFPGSDTTYGTTNVGSPVSITLSYPTVTITSCPVVVKSADNYKSGYIREGATFTCQCNLANSGNPTGAIVWLNSAGHTVSTRNLLRSDVAKSGESFTCRGSSPIRIGFNPLADETYSPNVAYGPTQVTVSLVDGQGESRTLCPSHTLSIPVVCQTPLVNISPKPRCSILVTKSGLTSYTEDFSADQGQVQSGQYTFSSDVPVTEAGDYVVTCTMYNSVFGDLTDSDSIELSVTDPVISHPVFTVNGKVRDEQIVPGDNVTVTCSDTGVIGEHIDLLCINNRVNINPDDEDKIEFLSVRTADNGTVCVCKWTSTLGCLLQGTKTLTVTISLSESELGGDDGDSEFPVTFVVIAALGVLCAVLAVIIAVLVIRRRRNKPNQDRNQTSPQQRRRTSQPEETRAHAEPVTSGRDVSRMDQSKNAYDEIDVEPVTAPDGQLQTTVTFSRSAQENQGHTTDSSSPYLFPDLVPPSTPRAPSHVQENPYLEIDEERMAAYLFEQPPSHPRTPAANNLYSVPRTGASPLPATSTSGEKDGYTRMDVPSAKEKTRATHQYMNVNTNKAY